MNNETFGIAFQFAICSYFEIDNDKLYPFFNYLPSVILVKKDLF